MINLFSPVKPLLILLYFTEFGQLADIFYRQIRNRSCIGELAAAIAWWTHYGHSGKKDLAPKWTHLRMMVDRLSRLRTTMKPLGMKVSRGSHISGSPMTCPLEAPHFTILRRRPRGPGKKNKVAKRSERRPRKQSSQKSSQPKPSANLGSPTAEPALAVVTAPNDNDISEEIVFDSRLGMLMENIDFKSTQDFTIIVEPFVHPQPQTQVPPVALSQPETNLNFEYNYETAPDCATEFESNFWNPLSTYPEERYLSDIVAALDHPEGYTPPKRWADEPNDEFYNFNLSGS